MAESRDSLILLERAQGGDRDALGRLLQELVPYLAMIVRTVRGSHQAAGLNDSDVVQDVLLLATKKLQTFRGASMAELVGWLRTITIRSARDHLYRGSEQCLDDLDFVDATGSSPSGLVIRLEESARIAEAMSRIPPEMQQILTLRLVEDLDHGEIARRMNRTPGATRVLFFRAVRRIRDICAEHESES